MIVLVAGPDPAGLGPALAAAGATVTPIDGAVTASGLSQAGIEDADIFVLTDPTEATAIPLSRELQSELKIVVYAENALPPFAAHLADLIIDPASIDQSIVVEEVLGTADLT